MNQYITIAKFAKRYGLQEKTIMRRKNEIPGIINNGEWMILDSARYPADGRWLREKSSEGKRYALLKSIAYYRYIDPELLRISASSFDLLIKQLYEAKLIENNGSGDLNGANAYDCTKEGERLLEASKRKIIRYLAEICGVFTGAVISQAMK